MTKNSACVGARGRKMPMIARKGARDPDQKLTQKPEKPAKTGPIFKDFFDVKRGWERDSALQKGPPNTTQKTVNCPKMPNLLLATLFGVKFVFACAAKVTQMCTFALPTF